MAQQYQVLARKWRPQQFDDVVGQEHVTTTLKNAIAQNRLAHAYLFVGPRGIGKTSIARIFAKALNCVKGPTATPCDECDSCREITEGRSLDVLEIDGASNNGVEQVRELRDTVRYAPARGKFKIYIIDEVHMLTTQAFNALLKTLEEPPAHVKFIFATTEPQKVLPTILSRCQRFDLRRIPASLIVKHLKEIAKKEKVAIDDEALAAIARGAEGGLRDAESTLDQLIAFCGNKIAEADVLSVFGLVAHDRIAALTDAVLDGQTTKSLQVLKELDDAGQRPATPRGGFARSFSQFADCDAGGGGRCVLAIARIRNGPACGAGQAHGFRRGAADHRRAGGRRGTAPLRVIEARVFRDRAGESRQGARHGRDRRLAEETERIEGWGAVKPPCGSMFLSQKPRL